MTRALGIDQGTTGTKGAVLDDGGHLESVTAPEHRQIHPHPGWVEHDPAELVTAVATTLELAGEVDAVGLANQGETVVAWDAVTKEPLANAIVWQDVRTRPEIERLRAEGAEALTLERAGLPLDPYFSAAKLRWLLDHVDGARSLLGRERLRLGTTDTFFLDRLAGVFVTDATTASRTSLMNLRTRDWDDDLLALFGVPREALAPIGRTTGPLGAAKVGAREVPIVASVVDQQAALFGHGARAKGQSKITFGTGAFCLSVTGSEIRSDADSGLLPTIAWWLDGQDPVYALDGGVYDAAGAINWMRRVGLFADFAELGDFEGPSAVERGLCFVPALSGLGAPYWDRSAAGMWLGIGHDTSRADLCRAVIEGVALRSVQVLRAMSRLTGEAGDVSVDGGMSGNAYLCQFLASAAARRISVPSTADLTAFGTAQLTLLGSRAVADSAALPPGPAPRLVVEPQSVLPESAHDRFARAVEACRGFRD